MNTQATHSLVIEREMPHSPEKIWRALTQGDLIKQWLMENDFTPSVGHKFNFRAAPVGGWNGVVESQVLEVEPNKKLSYSWTSMGLESVVSWTLAAVGGGTLLRFEQTGFRPDQEANYKGAKYGWEMFIGKMDKVVEGLH